MANFAETEYRIYDTSKNVKMLIKDFTQFYKMSSLKEVAEYFGADTEFGYGDIFHLYINEDDRGAFIAICANTKWDYNPDFVNAMREAGVIIEWESIEHGCHVYQTSVEGGFYGKYLVCTEDEEEYAKDKYKCMRLVEMFLKSFGEEQFFLTFDECRAFVDRWNKKNEDKYINIYAFEKI